MYSFRVITVDAHRSAMPIMPDRSEPDRCRSPASKSTSVLPPKPECSSIAMCESLYGYTGRVEEARKNATPETPAAASVANTATLIVPPRAAVANAQSTYLNRKAVGNASGPLGVCAGCIVRPQDPSSPAEMLGIEELLPNVNLITCAHLTCQEKSIYDAGSLPARHRSGQSWLPVQPRSIGSECHAPWPSSTKRSS